MTLLIPKRLSWREGDVTHAVLYDDDAEIPMWVTCCGMGPLVVSIAHVWDGLPDCIACIAEGR